MTTKYQNSSDVPLSAIIARLNELSDAITGGKESRDREFTMRIPAECDRDADLVIAEAAVRLSFLQAEIEALRAANRDLQAWFDDARAEAERLRARANRYESENLECCAEILEAEAGAIGGSGLGKKMTKIRLQCLAQRLRQQADKADQAGGNQ